MNLDSEEEGALYVGCAGGRDTTGTWTVAHDPAPARSVALDLAVTGLKGGHSGMEIDKGRGNALKILNRVLIALEGVGARLSRWMAVTNSTRFSLRGPGPRVRARGPSRRLVALVGHSGTRPSAPSSRTVEPDLACRPRRRRRGAGACSSGRPNSRSRAPSRRCRHGVMKMSATSRSRRDLDQRAVVTTKAKKVSVSTSQRSSVASEITRFGAGPWHHLRDGRRRRAAGRRLPGLEAQHRLRRSSNTPWRPTLALREGAGGEGHPTPASNAASSARSTRASTWCRSGRRSRACTRPTRRSSSTRFRSSGAF